MCIHKQLQRCILRGLKIHSRISGMSTHGSCHEYEDLSGLESIAKLAPFILDGLNVVTGSAKDFNT